MKKQIVMERLDDFMHEQHQCDVQVLNNPSIRGNSYIDETGDFTNFTIHTAHCVRRDGESITQMQRQRHHI